MSATDVSSQLLDFLVSDEGGRASLSREYFERQPVADIIFDPAENYRWGSKEKMTADLAKEGQVGEDGTRVSSYEVVKQSIRTIGVQEAVGLVRRPDGLHVVYGFTRVHICKELNIAHLPAYIYGDIDDSDIELLQVRENSPALKRAVNWVAETEMYSSLWGAVFIRRCEKKGLSDTSSQAAATERRLAKEAVCRTLGRNPSRMKSAEHFLRVLDGRVIDLAREGRIDYAAAQEFHSNDVDNPYKPARITAILRYLKGTDGYPSAITASRVRQAKKVADLDFERAADSSVDVGDEPEEREVKRGASTAPLQRENRQSEKAAARVGAPSPVSAMKGAERIRSSSAQLRDLSDLVAWNAIAGMKLTVKSPSDAGERLIGSAAWYEIRGIGWGSDTVTMPPLVETILAKRDEEDAEVQRMQRQHEISAERFVLTAFVRAFMRMAMDDQGIRNLDYDEKGWISGKTPKADGEGHIHHRDVWTRAVHDAVAMPGRVKLLDRAKHAWEQVRPYVKSARAKA